MEGSGGISPWLPSSLSGGGGPRPSAHPPSRRRRITSRCTRSAGVVGLPAAGGPAWRGGGGGEGRSVTCPSGGVAGGPGGPGVVLPRSVPLPSPGVQHCGRHRRRPGRGGAPPILLRLVVVGRPRAWPARWSCALVRVRSPAASPAGAGSGGRGGARRAGRAASPFRASRSFLGEGDAPSAAGGG